MTDIFELYSDLDAAEIERLACLMEEMGEAQQIIGKILRHGYSSYSPFDESETTNKELLEKELGDVQAIIDTMVKAKDIRRSKIDEHSSRKSITMVPYLHHQ